jgi:serine/threonine protein phosphatase PrpC
MRAGARQCARAHRHSFGYRPGMGGLALECAARSDVGRVRADNEDSVFASPRLAAVADGVGGAAAGEVASRTVIDALVALDKSWLDRRLEDALAEAVAWGNQTVGFLVSCRPEMAGMGTTLTAVALADDGRYVVAQVGDSRAYLLRDGRLTQLTRDDSWVQELVDRGEITREQARRHPRRSVVLQALDGDPGRRASLATRRARPGDRLLICSDGLSDVVGDDELAAALRHPSRAACADELIERALVAGGRDNVSVIVADVGARRDAATAWQRVA